MGLHIELAADAGIAVDNQIVDTERIELLATSQTGRTGPDDGHRRFINGKGIHRLSFGGSLESDPRQVGLMGDETHLLHPIDGCDANATHTAVNQHLAGTTLADAALQRAVSARKGMAMHGIACLVEGFSNGVALVATHRFAFKQKLHFLALRNVEYRMPFNLIHIVSFYRLIDCTIMDIPLYCHKGINNNSKLQVFFSTPSSCLIPL